MAVNAPRSFDHQTGPLLLAAPAGIFLALFYLVPLLQIFLLSLQGAPTAFGHYLDIVRDPLQLKVLSNTLTLSLSVAGICLLAGYPVAWLLVTATERVRRIVILIVIASLWTSILVRTYSWMVLLGREGPINGLLQALGLIEKPLTLLYGTFSVYIGMVHIMLPFMIMPLYSVMQRVDLRLLRNAQSLGAGPLVSFWLIFFPLSLPGVLAGWLLVFIISMGFFITPSLLGSIENTTFVMLIEREVNTLLNWQLAAAMSIVLLAATLLLVGLYQYVLSPEGKAGSRAGAPLLSALSHIFGVAMRGRALLLDRVPVLRSGWISTLLVRTAARIGATLVRGLPWLVLLFLLAPLLIVFPLSFSGSSFLEFPPSSYSLRWYQNALGRADWMTPIATSFKVACSVVIVATLLGVIAAIPLARREFRGKALLLGSMMSPMIVPVLVFAVSLQFFTSRIGMAGTLTGLIMGHIVIALPFVIVVMVNALKSANVDLERVAMTLGAPPWRAFCATTLVLIRPAILTAALFAFLASFDELIIALFLSGPETTTLPKRLWDGVREEIDPTTAAIAVLITVLSLSLLAIAEWMRTRAARRTNLDVGARQEGIAELRRQGLFR